MSSMNRLIELLNEKDYSNEKNVLEKLKIQLSKVNDKLKYTPEFITELNDLLAPNEKFSDEELKFLINFSSITRYSSKEFLFKRLTEQEKYIFDNIENRVLKSIDFYNKKITDNIDINNLLKKLSFKGNNLINNYEIDFIVKLAKENFNKNDLIDILKEVNKINMSIYRKYEFDDLDYDEVESSLEITNLSYADIEGLLSNYNIDFSSFNDELKNKLLKYGNIDKMKEILDFLKREKILHMEDVLIPDILVRTLLYSNIEKLEAVKVKNKINFIDLVRKIPTVLYPTTKEKKKKNDLPYMSWDKSSRSGSMTNYNRNSDLINDLGISFDDVWRKCYSFFIQSYKANKASIDALESYGISIKKEDGSLRQIFSVLGNRNPSIIDIYDYALEADAKEYALKASSTLAPSQMYKFSLIKLAKRNGLDDSKIFCYYTTPNKEISLKIKNIVNDLNVTDISNINDLYKSVRVNIPNQKIYDNIFDISDLNILTDDILEDKNIKALEQFADSVELYNFNGVRISRKKVLRRYLALKNNDKSDSMSALMYCITYGSLLDSKEFNNIYDSVKSCISLPYDDNIYAYYDEKNNIMSGGLKYD